MTRGAPSVVGETRIAQNGYHYTKTDIGWQLTHRMMMEAYLGRPLDHDEQVRFKDKDKTNLKLSNLEVVKTKTATLRKQLAEIDQKIAELQYKRLQIKKKLDNLDK